MKKSQVAIIVFCLVSATVAQPAKRSEDLTQDLLDAAYHGRTADITSLLDAGADVDQMGLISVPGFRGVQALSPLMNAARGGSLDAVRLLVDRGAHICQRGSFGQTALMWTDYQTQRSIYNYLEKWNCNAK